MTKKTLGIALIAIVIIAIAGLFFPKGDAVVQKIIVAVSSLDGIDNPYVSINGNKSFYFSSSLQATSSFVCALQNPYRATTSIVALSAEATNRTGGIAQANALYISTSTTAFGTSSPALVQAFAMGTGQWTLEFQKNTATTSTAASSGWGVHADLLPGMTTTGASNYILGPSEWITWKYATTTGGTYVTYDTGTCSAILGRP